MVSKAMIATVAIIGVLNVAVVGADPLEASNNLRGAPDHSTEVCRVSRTARRCMVTYDTVRQEGVVSLRVYNYEHQIPTVHAWCTFALSPYRR